GVELHRCQHAVGTGLHGQVDECHQRGKLGVGLDQRVGEFQRVAGGVADAFDAIEGGNQVQQVGEVAQAAVRVGAPVTVDVLAEQGDFLHTVFSQVNDFRQDVRHRTADFLATGVRNHAEGAVLAA